MFSAGLGFARDVLVARAFGASEITDAFFIALFLPGMIAVNLFARLSVGSLVPALARSGAASYCGADAGAHTLTVGAAAGAAALGGIMALVAPMIVGAIGPGLSPAAAVMAFRMLRILAVMLLLAAVAEVAAARLLAARRFGAFAAGAPVSNAVFVIAFASVASRWGWLALPLLVVLGTLCRTLYLSAVLWRTGARASHAPRSRATDFGGAGRLAASIGGTFALSQIGGWAERLLASRLAPGSVAALEFARRLARIPVAWCAYPLSSAAVPFLSKSAQSDVGKFRTTLSSTLWAVAVPAILAGVLLATFRTSVTTLLFRRGEFDLQDVEFTSSALLGYSYGIPAHAVNIVLSRACYAMGDGRTPLMIAALSTVGHVGLAFALCPTLKTYGLAGAYSFASLAANAVFLARTCAHLRRSGQGPRAPTSAGGRTAS